MGRHLSPWYGQVILVSGYPVLTAVNWSQHWCAISFLLGSQTKKHWLPCGADGRSFVRCTVTWLPNFLGWVDYLSYGASRARGAPLWRVIIANKCTWKVAHGSTICTVLPVNVYPQYLLKWSKHKAHFLRAVHIAKSLRFFYQFQRWVGMKRAELTNFFC